MSTFLSFWENKHWALEFFPAILIKRRTTEKRDFSEWTQASRINNWEVPERTCELTSKNLAYGISMLNIHSTHALVVLICASQAMVSLGSCTMPKPIFQELCPLCLIIKEEAEVWCGNDCKNRSSKKYPLHLKEWTFLSELFFLLTYQP